MNTPARAYRKGLLRLAAVAGILSALLLAVDKPVLAGNSAQEQVSRDFQKTVTLGAGQSVRVEHKFGEVRLHGESGREVKISATIRAQANSHEEAEAFAQKIQIEVLQSSEGVRIKTIYPDEEKKWFQLSKHSSWSVSYDIGMPVDAPLAVRNSFGSIDAARIHGKRRVNGHTSVNDNNGSVQVADVKGTLEVRNRFGSITMKDIQGAATVTGGNGAVILNNAASA